MSGVYLYALLGAPPAEERRGMRGEAVRAVEVGRFYAALGPMEEAPSLSEESLRNHDAAVRRLWEGADSFLPARFGSLIGDEEELRSLLCARAAELEEALLEVRGMEQMTLRVFGRSSGPVSPPVSAPPGSGPGARYLEALRRGKEPPDEIVRLLAALKGLIHGERVERSRAPGLLATVHHLALRGQGSLYRETAERSPELAAPARVSISGPWPPYAFAPEAIR